MLHRCIFTNILVLAQQVYSFLRPLTSLIIPLILRFSASVRISDKGEALHLSTLDELGYWGEPSRLYRPSVYRQIAACLEGRTTSCDTAGGQATAHYKVSPAIYFFDAENVLQL